MEIWEIERTIQDLEFKLDSLLQKKKIIIINHMEQMLNMNMEKQQLVQNTK